jgi:hypothetical protein
MRRGWRRRPEGCGNAEEHLTPGPSPISHPLIPGRGEDFGKQQAISFFPFSCFILNFSPLPAGAWVGDGRGAGGEVLQRRTSLTSSPT